MFCHFFRPLFEWTADISIPKDYSSNEIQVTTRIPWKPPFPVLYVWTNWLTLQAAIGPGAVSCPSTLHFHTKLMVFLCLANKQRRVFPKYSKRMLAGDDGFATYGLKTGDTCCTFTWFGDGPTSSSNSSSSPKIVSPSILFRSTIHFSFENQSIAPHLVANDTSVVYWKKGDPERGVGEKKKSMWKPRWLQVVYSVTEMTSTRVIQVDRTAHPDSVFADDVDEETLFFFYFFSFSPRPLERQNISCAP